MTVVYMQKSGHPSNAFKRTIKSSNWRHPYLMADMAKALLSAGNNYSILFILKSVLHVHRLNKISGGTPKMGARWYNFTKW